MDRFIIAKNEKNGSFYIFNIPYHCALFLHYLQEKAVFQNFITWYKKDGLSYTKKRFVNNQESILFYTMDSKSYYFDPESIRVPYESTSRIEHAKKNGILKNGKLCPDVWEIASQRHKQKVNGKTQKLHHPTIKPKEMIERMIKASSKKGDLVLDLFSGSGMTSLVARDLERNFIGCEASIEYVDSSLNIKEC